MISKSPSFIFNGIPHVYSSTLSWYAAVAWQEDSYGIAWKLTLVITNIFIIKILNKNDASLIMTEFAQLLSNFGGLAKGKEIMVFLKTNRLIHAMPHQA
jgi:hypothetical protein